MMAEVESATQIQTRWSILRIGGCSLLVAALFYVVQFVSMMFNFAILAAGEAKPDVEKWSNEIGMNGSFLSWSTFLTTAFCVPFVIYLTK
jgi:hypothetical protein